MRISILLFFLPFFTSAQDLPDSGPSSLEAIRVTSDLDKRNSPLIQAPGSFVKKDRETLKEQIPQDLDALLRQEPNVEFLGGPRGSTEMPQIRGLGSERILILEDGVRQNFQSTHSGRVFSDFSLIESLEIVKGPWSSLYGSGAMGGVISFRRSTANDFIRRTGRETGGEATLDGSSAAGGFGQRITGYTKRGFFEPLVSYRHSTANDLRLGGGETLSYSAFETHDLYTSLGFQIDEGHVFHLKLNSFSETGRKPLNPQLGDEAADQIADTVHLKQDLVGDYRKTGDGLDFHAKPYFRRSTVEKKRVSDGREDLQSVETMGLDAWNNWSIVFSERWESTTTLGAEIFRDRNRGERNGGTLDSFPEGETEQIGVYLQPSFTWNRKWAFTPGIRHDTYRTSDGTGRSADNSGQETSSKFYASYEYLPESTVFAGWGQAFNAPRLQDLYLSELHFPGQPPFVPNNFFVPNPDLKPERSDTFEFGTKRLVRGEEGIWSLEGVYFQTNARDFISREVDVPGGTTKFVNLNRVRLEGVELSVRWQSPDALAGLSYGQVRSLNRDTRDPLDDTPADRWNGKLERFLSDHWKIGTDLIWYQKQDRVTSRGERTGEAFVQDLYAQWAKSDWEAQLRVNNLHDREFRRHGSTLNEPGRDVRAAVSYLF